MKDKMPAKLRGFESFEQLKKKAEKFTETYDRFYLALAVPFAEYYAKYYRVMNDIPKPDGNTFFDLVEVDSQWARFVVHGYTHTDRQINPSPTTPEDPDSDPDDYYIVTETHTRERFVRFPLDFLEDKTPYLNQAEKKIAANLKNEKLAAESELRELHLQQEKLTKLIKQAEENAK